MGKQESFYLVFKGNNPSGDYPPEAGPSIPGQREPLRYVRYELITVVPASSPEDACHQVAQTIGQLGGYVAVEVFPFTFNLTPKRLLIEGEGIEELED